MCGNLARGGSRDRGSMAKSDRATTRDGDTGARAPGFSQSRPELSKKKLGSASIAGGQHSRRGPEESVSHRKTALKRGTPPQFNNCSFPNLKRPRYKYLLRRDPPAISVSSSFRYLAHRYRDQVPLPHLLVRFNNSALTSRCILHIPSFSQTHIPNKICHSHALLLDIKCHLGLPSWLTNIYLDDTLLTHAPRTRWIT